MSKTSGTRDLSQLEIVMDQWTEPFWKSTEEGRLTMPRCGGCGTYRWPPGPFCAQCHSQAVEWVPAGRAELFSYTIVPGKGDEPAHVPALIEFPEAGGMRMLGSLIDAPLDAIRIGEEVEVAWTDAANTKLPVFRLAGKNGRRQ